MVSAFVRLATSSSLWRLPPWGGNEEECVAIFRTHPAPEPLERFRAKHVLETDPRMITPVRVKKTRQINIIERSF
jgi:hypothetical protein